MAKAAKRMVSILNGALIKGTSFEQEFVDLLGHLGNLKGFMPKYYRDMSELKVEEIRLLYKMGADSHLITEPLYALLTFPIDYKDKRWKKISAQIKAHGNWCWRLC